MVQLSGSNSSATLRRQGSTAGKGNHLISVYTKYEMDCLITGRTQPITGGKNKANVVNYRIICKDSPYQCIHEVWGDGLSSIPEYVRRPQVTAVFQHQRKVFSQRYQKSNYFWTLNLSMQISCMKWIGSSVFQMKIGNHMFGSFRSPEDIGQTLNNLSRLTAPFCNGSVHMCAHFSCKMAHCGMLGLWHRFIFL